MHLVGRVHHRLGDGGVRVDHHGRTSRTEIPYSRASPSSWIRSVACGPMIVAPSSRSDGRSTTSRQNRWSRRSPGPCRWRRGAPCPRPRRRPTPARPPRSAPPARSRGACDAGRHHRAVEHPRAVEGRLDRVRPLGLAQVRELGGRDRVADRERRRRRRSAGARRPGSGRARRRIAQLLQPDVRRVRGPADGHRAPARRSRRCRRTGAARPRRRGTPRTSDTVVPASTSTPWRDSAWADRLARRAAPRWRAARAGPRSGSRGSRAARASRRTRSRSRRRPR